jgi:hypothetical protein
MADNLDEEHVENPTNIQPESATGDGSPIYVTSSETACSKN